MVTASGGTRRATDARVVQTRAAVESALQTLLKTNAPTEISISELCATAGISRPTFYLHYGTIEDVRIALVLRGLQRLGAQLADQPRMDVPRLAGFFQAHRDELRELLFSTAHQPRVRLAVAGWLRDQMAQEVYGAPFDEIDSPRQVRLIFAAGGLVATLTDDSLGDSAINPDLVTTLEDLVGDVLAVSAHT